jgi:single-strand DNA-binding protein
MKNYNQVGICGRFGKTPELKKTNGGKNVISASIAVNGYKDNETFWIEIAAWEKVAEIIAKYCVKGTKVTIGGELRTQSWDDSDGKKRTKTYVLVNHVELGEKPSSDGSSGSKSSQTKKEPAKNSFDDDEDNMLKNQ